MALTTEAAHALIADLHLLGRMMRRALASDDNAEIHQGGLGVLAALAASEPCRQMDLATDLCLSQSALSRHITELVNGGYVARQSDPQDGRATRVSLTPAGRELLYRNRDLRARELQKVLADWPEADAEAARITVQKLKQSLNDHMHRTGRLEPTADGEVESEEVCV